MLVLLAILALALVAVEQRAPAPAAVRSLDDVRQALKDGVAAAALARSIAESGAVIGLGAEEATRLYLEGVPLEVIQAIFSSSGSPYPRVAACAGGIELRYEGYRLLGRGEAVLVSGYACDGDRLAPAVEPPAPEAEAAEAARQAAEMAREKAEEDAAAERRRAAVEKRKQLKLEREEEERRAAEQQAAQTALAYSSVPIFWFAYPVYPFPLPPPAPDPAPSPSPAEPGPVQPPSLAWPFFDSLAWPDLKMPQPAPVVRAAAPAPTPAPQVVRDRISR